ncbi:hypothetical protein BD410DRAFT_809909 [Rickenella mellea]|uniref:Uncharacterized protein n=1 Tax=Rickenella mellea TaxID=50990 RepID=A0A4Y7PHC0_9AGAM|nr:hypothetical protein BD410DRAFT_809909 [Rickenella mellea]
MNHANSSFIELYTIMFQNLVQRISNKDDLFKLLRLHQDYVDSIRTPCGVHEDLWGTVKYRSDPTSLQVAKLQERRTLLHRRIESWQEIQAVYIPCVVQIRRSIAQLLPSSTRPEEAEDIPLYLPSDVIGRGTCDLDLQQKEWQLRFAQANEALASLRNDLRFWSYLYKDKDRQSTGQGPNTRAQSLINRASAKAKYSASIYRTARAALVKLGTGPDGRQWETGLQPLLEQDLRNVNEGTIGQTEGNKSISWIWTAPGIRDAIETTGDGNRDVGLHDAIRVEWAKARARAHRWQEEVQLLLEEMRRVLTFLAHRAEWWRGLVVLCKGVPEHLAEGLSSYAHHQAAINLHIRKWFQSMWSAMPVYAQLGWAELVAESD